MSPLPVEDLVVDVELLPKFCCVTLEPVEGGAGVGGFQTKYMTMTRARAMTIGRIRLKFHLEVETIEGLNVSIGGMSGSGTAGIGIVCCCSMELYLCGSVV